jgi:hypothetical protein
MHLNEKNDHYESKNNLTGGIFALFINKREFSTRHQALMSEPSLRTVDV